MPLDSVLKQNHVYTAVKKTWAGRTRVVVFVSQNAGVWSYAAQTVIFRPLEVIDVEQPDTSGGTPKLRADTIMIVDIAISMTGVVYVADTTTATAGAVASASKYEVIEATQSGIITTFTQWEVDLRRMR